MSNSATLYTVAHQAPLSMGFSRQEYWSGLPCPSLDLPNPEIKPKSPASSALQADSLPTETPGKPDPNPSIQSLSHVQLCVTPWTAACQASLSITNSQSWLKSMSTESVMPSNHPRLCGILLLPPSTFPNIKVFSNVSLLRIRWPQYWTYGFSPSNEYSGLISFRMDLLDLLAVQETLKSLLQHHSSKASILQC